MDPLGSGIDPEFAEEGLTFCDSESQYATRKLLRSFAESYHRHVFTPLELEASQQPQSVKDLSVGSAQAAMLRTMLDGGLIFRAINKYDGVPMHLPSTVWVCLREKLLAADVFHKGSTKQVHDYCLTKLALGRPVHKACLSLVTMRSMDVHATKRTMTSLCWTILWASRLPLEWTTSRSNGWTKVKCVTSG